MKKKFLDGIENSSDIKKIDKENLDALCAEIREIIIKTVSKNGGHLASNLGVVELTVAIHRVLDLPGDSIVFDVGHQCYAHKILSGRAGKFSTLRKKNGVSGFPKPSESNLDAFIAGHACSSVSAALGIAEANSLSKNNATVVAVVGDGAMAGGMIYEALNNAGKSGKGLIVILNDNEMSIGKSVGAIARYLAGIRSSRGYFSFKSLVSRTIEKAPIIGKPTVKAIQTSKSALKNALYHTTFFEDFGIDYYGPVDGHDIETMCDVLLEAKLQKKPCVVHVYTKKGKGYAFAEENPGAYHGVSAFNVKIGSEENNGDDTFSGVFGRKINELGQKSRRVCAVTAAMKYGTGLQIFAANHRSRFFDVGIAEPHAVTFCAGLASKKMRPVFAVYSTFLQRSYDQILHDAAIPNLHVVLAIDRAGIVGEDGETHQGLFDVPMLLSVPNVQIFSPSTYKELENNLERAVMHMNGVCAVRYPRGAESPYLKDYVQSPADYDYIPGSDGSPLLITYGRLFAEAYQAQKELDGKISVLKINRLTMDLTEIAAICKRHTEVCFYEECVRTGSLSQKLCTYLMEGQAAVKYSAVTVPDEFVKQMTTSEAFSLFSFDKDSIIQRFKGGI